MENGMMKEPKPSLHDPQQVIINLLAVKYLRECDGQTMILSHKDMEALAKFTIRLEIVHPQDPATSPIKCSAITVADAVKFMQDLQRSQGKLIV